MPTDVHTRLSLRNSLIDDSFDPKRGATSELILQISQAAIVLVVKDLHKGRFVALENYFLQDRLHDLNVKDVIDELSRTSQLLSTSFGKVRCVIVNNMSTLVPNAVFENDNKRLYLKFNVTLKGDELVMADEIPSLDARTVYALPLSLKMKLDSTFRNAEYSHFSTHLVSALLTICRNMSRQKVFLHIQDDHFDMVVIEGKKLIFYNTFNHQSAEDLVYYFLFACEQLQINPEHIDVSLLGEIEKNSTIYQLLYKYVRHLSFGERAEADMSYQLQELPRHYFFTLLA